MKITIYLDLEDEGKDYKLLEEILENYDPENEGFNDFLKYLLKTGLKEL